MPRSDTPSRLLCEIERHETSSRLFHAASASIAGVIMAVTPPLLKTGAIRLVVDAEADLAVVPAPVTRQSGYVWRV